LFACGSIFVSWKFNRNPLDNITAHFGKHSFIRWLRVLKHIFSYLPGCGVLHGLSTRSQEADSLSWSRLWITSRNFILGKSWLINRVKWQVSVLSRWGELLLVCQNHRLILWMRGLLFILDLKRVSSSSEGAIFLRGLHLSLKHFNVLLMFLFTNLIQTVLR
jgi:hypothetical protein